MNVQQTTSSRWVRGLSTGMLAVALTTTVTVLGCSGQAPEPTPPPAAPTLSAAELNARVHETCGACHAYPPPETFPRRVWKEEVERGFYFFYKANLKLTAPPIDQVIKYYEDRAPDKLPPAVIAKATTPLPVQLERLGLPAPAGDHRPLISFVNLVHLSDARRLELLATDMGAGLVMTLRPWEAKPSWHVLAKVKNPAHVEVVDLDGDGIKDLVVADLGSFEPVDRLCGSVVWLRGTAEGRFTPITLLKDVGRVADVQVADFNGDGKRDLVVAVFGWRTTGNILVLENRTTDWKHPVFVPKIIDWRHGAIHVPVSDLNGDGKPDFVALIAQEHETVVAFLNDGKGGFRAKPLYTAAHPAYGSSGIQLTDLNGDGKPDVLYTNGDVLDSPYLLKPYHKVQWLENRTTDWEKPEFTHHPIGAMYGVHRAVAGDIDGDGRPDILAVSYLPVEHFAQREERNLDAVVVFRQTAPGTFERHTLESKTCDHVTCALGDLFGTGRLDLITADFRRSAGGDAVTVWKNLGPPPNK